MSLVNTGISAIGKLLIVVALAVAFLLGLLGVVALALRGEEVKVPEIVGKDFLDSEKELTQLGLKIKKRALRYSEEKPNTILEQLPKPGETVKTGQIILVVVSQENPEGQEAPATVKKDDETSEEDAHTAPDVASPDKPKKVTNKNADTNKRATTTRDVVANKPAKNSNSASNSAITGANTKANTISPATTSSPKATPAPNTKPVATPGKPTPPAGDKPSTTGDTRTRKVP